MTDTTIADQPRGHARCGEMRPSNSRAIHAHFTRDPSFVGGTSMARETTQPDKRTQSKNQKPPSSRNTAATDRQTPIQSSRDDVRPTATPRTTQASEPVQQSGIVGRRGVSAPVRGGVSSPFDLMQRMSDDMDRLLEQFGFGRMGLGLGPRLGASLGSDIVDRARGVDGGQSLWAPLVETTRRGDRFVVRADLPGIKKDDVHVEVDDDVLTISGERRNEQKEERDGFFRSERSYGSFFRAIPLPDGVNANQCEAKFSDGVLEISLAAPKQEERKAKKIEVR
jgi:HSP20 family protein